MIRRAPATWLPALGAVVVLLGASACSGTGADGPVAPIVMTDGDGVLHGPDDGATPVSPAEPAPAGRDVVTAPPEAEQETRRETEPPAPPPAELDDDPEPPPPPPPPPPADDDADDDDGSDDADDTPDGDDDSLDEADDD